MEPTVHTIHTLQEFMTQTKAVLYLLMGAGLICIPLFWRFVTGRDNDKRTY